MEFVPRLRIHNLGAIKDCEIPMNRMTVLTGAQAEGKSTIAKAIYFFRTLKDEIAKNVFTDWVDPVPGINAKWHLLKKLSRIFGNYISFSNGTYLSYEYTPDIKIEIGVKDSTYTPIKFSDKILEKIENYRDIDNGNQNIIDVRRDLKNFFNDEHEIIYIPAGRSFTSLFTNQLNFILLSLNDKQKDTFDYCMMEYLERVMKIKPLLEVHPLDYELSKLADPEHFLFMHVTQEHLQRILKGQYVNKNGIDEIKVFYSESEQSIPLNFASSGQQEALWILNLIYYYLREKIPTTFIIEEPEAHLYPDAQKWIAEYIVAALKQDNECIVTTHSPYILGAINNILDISRLENKGINVRELRAENELLYCVKREEVNSYFISDGKLENAMDEESGLIRNEMIDGASDEINRLADKIFDLESESGL